MSGRLPGVVLCAVFLAAGLACLWALSRGGSERRSTPPAGIGPSGPGNGPQTAAEDLGVPPDVRAAETDALEAMLRHLPPDDPPPPPPRCRAQLPDDWPARYWDIAHHLRTERTDQP